MNISRYSLLALMIFTGCSGGAENAEHASFSLCGSDAGSTYMKINSVYSSSDLSYREKMAKEVYMLFESGIDDICGSVSSPKDRALVMINMLRLSATYLPEARLFAVKKVQPHIASNDKDIAYEAISLWAAVGGTEEYMYLEKLASRGRIDAQSWSDAKVIFNARNIGGL